MSKRGQLLALPGGQGRSMKLLILASSTWGGIEHGGLGEQKNGLRVWPASPGLWQQTQIVSLNLISLKLSPVGGHWAGGWHRSQSVKHWLLAHARRAIGKFTFTYRLCSGHKSMGWDFTIPNASAFHLPCLSVSKAKLSPVLRIPFPQTIGPCSSCTAPRERLGSVTVG